MVLATKIHILSGHLSSLQNHGPLNVNKCKLNSCDLFNKNSDCLLCNYWLCFNVYYHWSAEVITVCYPEHFQNTPADVDIQN